MRISKQFAQPLPRSSLLKFAEAFARNRDGGAAVMFGLSLPVVGLLAGVAVDYVRAVSLKPALQGAIDAAAVSAAGAVRNGLSTNEATALGVDVFTSAISGKHIVAGTPTIQVASATNASGAITYTASATVSGTTPSLFAGVTKVSSLSLSVAATATATQGPTGTIGTAAGVNGSAYIWGDPNIATTSNKIAGQNSGNLNCASGNWYNLLSDGKFQINAICENYTGSMYVLGAFYIQAGTHTLKYIGGPSSVFTTGGTTTENTFSWGVSGQYTNYSDDTLPTAVSSMTNAYGADTQSTGGVDTPGEIYVDGVSAAPAIAPSWSTKTTTLVNDTTEGVTISVTASPHMGTLATTLHNPSASPDTYLYDYATVVTPHYTAYIFFEGGGFGQVWLQTTSAGMCGNPGGVLGKNMTLTVSQFNAIPVSSYVVASPTTQSSEFAWTPTCGGSGVVAHLTR
ncbi:MAG: hypothetical protein KGM42_09490 [Hyphomicrobiales bacterium]|nr:hypothetical protein [Hyphomicrobiales bacterium]